MSCDFERKVSKIEILDNFEIYSLQSLCLLILNNNNLYLFTFHKSLEKKYKQLRNLMQYQITVYYDLINEHQLISFTEILVYYFLAEISIKTNYCLIQTIIGAYVYILYWYTIDTRILNCSCKLKLLRRVSN